MAFFETLTGLSRNTFRTSYEPRCWTLYVWCHPFQRILGFLLVPSNLTSGDCCTQAWSSSSCCRCYTGAGCGLHVRQRTWSTGSLVTGSALQIKLFFKVNGSCVLSINVHMRSVRACMHACVCVVWEKSMYIVAWFLHNTDSVTWCLMDRLDWRGFISLQKFCTQFERQTIQRAPDSQEDLRPHREKKQLQKDWVSGHRSPLPWLSSRFHFMVPQSLLLPGCNSLLRRRQVLVWVSSATYSTQPSTARHLPGWEEGWFAYMNKGRAASAAQELSLHCKKRLLWGFLISIQRCKLLWGGLQWWEDIFTLKGKG